MGTSAWIMRLREDGRLDRITLSHDGYLVGGGAGAGVKLLRHYSDPDKVERMFTQGFSWTTSIEEEPERMSWHRGCPADEPLDAAAWMSAVSDDEVRLRREVEFAAATGAREVRNRDGSVSLAPAREYDEDDFAPGAYMWAHGRWAYPTNAADLAAFLATGESAGAITRGMLAAQGATDEMFDAPVGDPLGTRRGRITVAMTDTGGGVVPVVTFDDGRLKGATLLPAQGFEGDAARVIGWDGRDVVIRESYVMAERSSEGGTSTVIGITSIELA